MHPGRNNLRAKPYVFRGTVGKSNFEYYFGRPKRLNMVKEKKDVVIKAPQRLISENMIRMMKLLIAHDVVKNRVEVARRLRMSQNSIYRIEKNEKFSFTLDQFFWFCREFDIPPADLFPK